MIQFAYYDSPCGLLEIGFDEAIVSLRRTDNPVHDHRPTPLSDLAARQLTEYFEGRRQVFDLPFRPVGTPFQAAVWQALSDIPYGETRSYKQIAEAIGRPTACRAVAAACGRNPIWILIPCHRVVGSSGALTGYAGGLDMKQFLLKLERR